MVFEKAKQIVATETSKEGISLDEKAKIEVAKTKKNLSYYRKITEAYIDKLTYKGREQDKRNYISKLWAALRDVLKDKKGTKEEMEKVRKDLSGRSESLKEKMIAQQRAHESMRFKAIKELNNENISKADFEVGITRLQDFKQSLSPLNQTDKSGNIDERQLRLDLQVQEQINSLKNLQKLYKAKYQEGTAFISSGQKYYVHSANNGVVVFSPYKHDETKKGSKPEIGKKQKMNWIEFQRMTEKAGCKVKKLQGNEYKDFDVDADKEVVESRAKIEELKRLKEINYIFSGKILGSIKNPKQKELMKQGIEEHYNSMRLYFEKDSNGVVKPTEVYNSLSVENRVKALIKMLSGLNSAIEKIKLQETLEKEKDPIKKLFFQAEMAFKSGDNMQAYAHFRAFKKKTDLWGYRNYQAQFSKLASSWDLSGAIKIAEGRLRQLSFKLINTAEKYVVSAIRQKASGLFISGDVAKKTYKETMQVLNGMRKALRSGDAYDVSTAWQKVGFPWYRARQDRMKGLKFSDLGRSETQLRIFHMPMIIKLTEVALITNKEEQKKKLLTLADDARKTKFRGPASILYKEYMQDDLHKYEKKQMKTKKYWEEKRKTYMALKKSTNPVIAAYRGDAKEIAMKSIGKEKFKKLTEEQKKILTERYEHILLENDVNKGATKNLFKSFLKSVKGDNKAAAKYIDMEDPFDEWFELSDAGVDTVKGIAGEAVVLACSGGLGNLAGKGVTAGLRTLAKKSAEKLAVRLATAGAGIAVDLVVSEIIDRSIRTVLMGQKGLFSKKELMNALKHSIATYGVLSLGGRVSRVVMRRLENAGQLARYAARVGQVVAVEAPLMATLNQGFSGWEGKWIDHYGQSMMTILASRAGMKLLHASTGNMLLKAEHSMEFKARLHTLKAKDPAKGALIDGMLKSGDLPKESVVQLMDSNLSTTEMKKLSKYMDDPKNAGFLLAIKYAEEHGTMTKKMKDRYQEHLLDLRMMGFSKSQAAKFAKSMTLQGLLTKYGEGAKKVAKDQLDSAIREQKTTEAKKWMKANLGKVKGWLKNPNIKEAFVTYMDKAQGNYAQFLQKYPKLAKIMPKDLTRLRIIPAPVLALNVGLPVEFKSVREIGDTQIKVEANKKYEGFKKIEVVEVDESNPRKPPKKIKVEKVDGTSEIIDANTPLYTITGPGGKKVTISASTAGHIDSLHIKGTEPGSNFSFKSFSEFVDALKKKLPKKVFLKDGKVVLSIDMGTHMGKEGISSMKELLESKRISKTDIRNADIVRQKVYDLNATGGQAAKQAFVNEFRSKYPDNKIQFQLVRGEVIVPIVKSPKKSTSSLFLVFGPDGKGGKTMYTAAPGRNMPRHPNPKQFTKQEGGVKRAAFKEAQRAWFDTVMLTDKTPQDFVVDGIKTGASKKAKALMDIIHKGDIVKSLRDGEIQKLFPEIASLFGKEKFQHKTQEFTLGGHTIATLIHLKYSPEYAKLVKGNPKNKIILELATLLHDVAKKSGTKEQKLTGKIKPDSGHELTSAELAFKVIDKMNLPKDIRSRVVRLVKNHSEISDIAIVRTKLRDAKIALQKAVASGDKKAIQEIEAEIQTLQKRADKNEKKLSQMADELYDPTNLNMLQALNYADIKSVNNKYKKSFKENKGIFDDVYKEIGELMDTVISNTRVENFTEDNPGVINMHLQIMNGMSYKQKSAYIVKLFGKNRVEALSVSEKLFHGTDVHNGTKYESILKNINRYKRDAGKVADCLSLIKGVRAMKNKDLQYGLMQILYARNPALYVAAMEKLTYGLDPKVSAKNKLEKIKKLREEFTTHEELTALDKLAHKVRKEIAEKMLDTHATDITGLTRIIMNGGLDTALSRKAKGEAVKSTRGDDFKLAGSLSVFTYQGSFWEAKGKDIFATIDSKFLNSKKANRSFYLTEDYVLKRPKNTNLKKDQLRKSIDEKLKDVMNRNDVKDYLAYRIAKHMMKEARAKGVKTEDIQYLDPSFKLTSYLNANSNTENLPSDKLGGRPEGHLKFKVPVDKLKIRVPKASVQELLIKAQKDLAKQEKYKDQGNSKYNPKDHAYLKNLIGQFEAAIKNDPKMTLKGFYVKAIKDAIFHYERLLENNPNSTKLKQIIARLKNINLDQIKEYEKGNLKGNQHKSKEYAEAVLGFEIPNSVQLHKYEEVHIFTRDKSIDVQLNKDLVTKFKDFLLKKKGVPESAVTIFGNKVIVNIKSLTAKDFNMRQEVYRFFHETHNAKPVEKVEKKKVVIPDALKPLGRILRAKTTDVAEIYTKLQKVKGNQRAMDGIINGVFKNKLGLSNEQIAAILETLK